MMAQANPYSAVSIQPDAQNACPAAHQIAETRLLVSNAPMLPLDDCDRITECRCRYKKWEDRRQEDRRALDNGIGSGFYQEDEKRSGKGRRASD